MPLISFERTILFTEVPSRRRWFPIVEVTFIKSDGQRYILPLLFDTGASCIMLRPEYAWLFPPSTSPVPIAAVGHSNSISCPRTSGQIEFLGVSMDCSIILSLIPPNPLWAGLFGRECFQQFGFGFWESTNKLYETLQPNLAES